MARAHRQGARQLLRQLQLTGERGSGAEESEQRLRRLPGQFLGNEVPGGHRVAADGAGALRAPQRERIEQALNDATLSP